MRAWEILETKLNGLTIIPIDRFIEKGYPKNNIEAEDLDEDEILDEADFGLGSKYRVAPEVELQDYIGRIKNNEPDKMDTYNLPYIHGNNIEIKNESGENYDLDALKKAITRRPTSLLKQNEKMKHSDGTADQYYNVGLPALKGLAVNEETGDFVVVDTCPGAGACKTFCYAKKGSYIMFKAVSMKQTQTLNFLLNDPEGFASELSREIQKAIDYWDKWSLNPKKNIDNIEVRVAIRFHDSGDFFSPEYMNMAFGVARSFPNNLFYAYTKIASAANSKDRPENFVLNFSAGALSTQSKLVNITGPNAAKYSQVVPKDMFFDLIAREGNKIIKNAEGATQFKNPEAWDEFKDRLADKYKIDKDTILSYEEFMEKKMAHELDGKTKVNVVVAPGEGDISATDPNCIGTYLLFH
jgi:hypothetical protein